LSGAGTIFDGDTPRLGPDGQPLLYVFFFPVAACEIIDTWHAIGLRGTGSHDFAVADVFVPEERAMLWDFTTPRNPGRLYAFGVGIISPTFAAIALGIARGALDALADLSARKTPRAGGGILLRDQPVAQHRVGVAEAQLRGARSLLLETIRDAWAEADKNGSLTTDQRALLIWASAHATAMAKQAVDAAWELAGGSAVFGGSPFERRFRDMHMVTQHFSVASSHYADGGRIFLTTPPAG
jgi:alkylation response protein AidB-like acyl-CoA dehydrogenase